MGVARFLPTKDITKGKNEVFNIIKNEVDRNKTTLVYDFEIKNFADSLHPDDKMVGKAVSTVMEYAKRIHGSGDARQGVPMAKVRRACNAIAKTMRSAASKKGDKDGYLDSTKTELRTLGKSHQAFFDYTYNYTAPAD